MVGGPAYSCQHEAAMLSAFAMRVVVLAVAATIIASVVVGCASKQGAAHGQPAKETTRLILQGWGGAAPYLDEAAAHLDGAAMEVKLIPAKLAGKRWPLRSIFVADKIRRIAKALRLPRALDLGPDDMKKLSASLRESATKAFLSANRARRATQEVSAEGRRTDTELERGIAATEAIAQLFDAAADDLDLAKEAWIAAVLSGSARANSN